MGLGIDVSQWQGTIDWAKVKASSEHIEFAYIKACEGTGFADPQHVTNFNGAKAVGLQVGWYHFGHPNADPIQEADFLISIIKPLGYGDLPIILDIEVTDNVSDVDDWAIAFLNHVKSVTGHDVGWYSGEWFAKEHLPKTMQQFSFSWIAKYSTTAPSVKWMIWQNSQSGHVDGIQGNVDIDEGVSQLVQQAITRTTFNVVVVDHVFEAFAANNQTYVLYTALDHLHTPYEYKGNGLMIINGKSIQGIVYNGSTYVPWGALQDGIKAYKVEWLFTNL